MILPSLLAFPLLEGHACWSTCGRRTRPFSGRAFREHRTNVSVLPILFIVGALRAQRPYQLSATPVQARLPISPPHSLVDPRMRASNYIMVPQSLLVPPLKRWSGLIPFCAHRPNTTHDFSIKIIPACRGLRARGIDQTATLLVKLAPVLTLTIVRRPIPETWLPSPIEEGLTEHPYRRSICF